MALELTRSGSHGLALNHPKDSLKPKISPSIEVRGIEKLASSAIDFGFQGF
jgi:hypothetical protein